MRKMMVSCAALAACFAGGSAAVAGTATASSKATFTVASQCGIKGANVSLGTYNSTDTFMAIGNQLGYRLAGSDTFTKGANALGSVNMGSVTCDKGLPYVIEMRGMGPDSEIDLVLPTGKIWMIPTVKKIGDAIVEDNGARFWPARLSCQHCLCG